MGIENYYLLHWLISFVRQILVKLAKKLLLHCCCLGWLYDDIDIVSRVFAPNVGIPEDPVTGSAHTTLAAWWAPRLGPELRAEQASVRGGELDVRLVGERVHLTGCAVTVARGMLLT